MSNITAGYIKQWKKTVDKEMRKLFPDFVIQTTTRGYATKGYATLTVMAHKRRELTMDDCDIGSEIKAFLDSFYYFIPDTGEKLRVKYRIEFNVYAAVSFTSNT